jgi:amidase
MSRPAYELTATEAAAEIAAGRLTARALADSCLARAADREPVVQAFAFLDPAMVHAAAATLDAVPPGRRGPLHGIPAAFKDIMDTSDMPTCYNSPIYAGHRPKADASVVALTRAAGGLVFGKAVTTEFANRAPGPTTNPHNPAHTPGGSSSGSAASVAAGMVPLALGTQTSGSAIRPAAYCGVHGFKGSWGEISYAGIKLTSATMDTVGIYARSLADIALYRSVLTGTLPARFTGGNVATPRIGVCHTRFADQAKRYTHDMIDEVAARAEQAGARTTSFELPPHFDQLLDAHRWVSSYEGARSLAWEKSFHRDRISADLRDGRIQDGESCSAELYRSSARFGERCRLEFDDVLGDLDVLLTPAAPGEAPVGLRATGSAVFNTLWTFLHVPCVTIPGRTGPTGLPLGFQLIGRRGSDRRLLEIAAWIEQATRP